MSKNTNDGFGLNPVWHRMIYRCTDMATVGVKKLKLLCRVGHRGRHVVVDRRIDVSLRLPWASSWTSRFISIRC